MAKRQRVGGERRQRAFFAVAATGIATQAVTALSGPLSSRMLGPYGRGQMVLVGLIALTGSQLGVGGLQTAIGHEVGRLGRPARDVVRPHLVGWFRLSLIPALGAAVVLAVLMRSTHNWPVFAGFGFVLTIAYIAQQILYGMLQGERNVARINTYHMAGLTLNTTTIAVIYIVAPTRQATVLLAILLACICIGLVVGFQMLRAPTDGVGDIADAHALRTFARRSYISGVGMLDGLGLDVLLVNIMFGVTATGLYGVAVSATNVTTIVLVGIAQVLLPRLAAAPTAQSAARTRNRWVLASAGSALLMIGGLELVVSPVMRFAFGPLFVGIIGTARLLIISWAILGFRKVLTAVAQSQGLAAFASKVEGASLVVMLVGIIALGQAVGLHAVPYGIGAAGLFSCASLATVIKWRTGARVNVTEVPSPAGLGSAPTP